MFGETPVGVGLTTWLTAMLAGRSTLGWYGSRGSFGESEEDPDFRFMLLFSISCNVRAYLLPGTVDNVLVGTEGHPGRNSHFLT